MVGKGLDYTGFLKENLPKMLDQRGHSYYQYSAVWLITGNDVTFKYRPYYKDPRNPVINKDKLFSPYGNANANYIVARPAGSTRHAENVIFDQVQFSTV